MRSKRPTLPRALACGEALGAHNASSEGVAPQPRRSSAQRQQGARCRQSSEEQRSAPWGSADCA